jgi:AcrR family transcriptional regulator
MRIRKTGEQRRLEIIDTALRLAATHGPDRISAEAIARELGLSQPAVFRHFPRKGDIWNAVIQRLAEELSQVWATNAESSQPSDRLLAVLDAHLRFISGHPAVPLVLLSPELQARHPELRSAIAHLMKLFHARLCDLVALADDVPPTEVAAVARMIISLVQGIAVRWAGSGQAFDIVTEGGMLIRLATRGLIKPLPPVAASS